MLWSHIDDILIVLKDLTIDTSNITLLIFY